MTPVLTFPEAKAYLKISQASLWRLMAAHKVAFVKSGRSTRFLQADLDAYLSRCRVKTDAELLEVLGSGKPRRFA